MSIRLVNGAYIADTARVLGEVTLHPGVNVWYGVSIRGDVAKLAIGARTNVQDNAVVHADYDKPNIIGCDVTIGHGAIVHGAEVGDLTLIGMGAILLGETKVGKECIVGAGAVLAPGTIVPDGMMVLGVPGKVVRPLTDAERAGLRESVEHYLKLARLHHKKRDDRRVIPWGKK